METFITFNKSAFKHGECEDDIRSALSRGVLEAAIKDEPVQILIVGFDTKGNLLEVMYNVTDGNIVDVFHAMKCRKKYIDIIERNKEYAAID